MSNRSIQYDNASPLRTSSPMRFAPHPPPPPPQLRKSVTTGPTSSNSSSSRSSMISNTASTVQSSHRGSTSLSGRASISSSSSSTNIAAFANNSMNINHEQSIDRLLSSTSSSSLPRPTKQTYNKLTSIPMNGSYLGNLNSSNNKENSNNGGVITNENYQQGKFQLSNNSTLIPNLSLSQIRTNTKGAQYQQHHPSFNNQNKQSSTTKQLECAPTAASSLRYSKSTVIETNETQYNQLSVDPLLSSSRLTNSKISPRILRPQSQNNPSGVSVKTVGDEEISVDEKYKNDKEAIDIFKQREVQYLTRIHQLEKSNRQMSETIAKAEAQGANTRNNENATATAAMQQKHIRMLEIYVETLTKKLAQIEEQKQHNVSTASNFGEGSTQEESKGVLKTLMKKYIVLENAHSRIVAENVFYQGSVQQLLQHGKQHEKSTGNSTSNSSVLKVLSLATTCE